MFWADTGGLACLSCWGHGCGRGRGGALCKPRSAGAKSTGEEVRDQCFPVLCKIIDAALRACRRLNDFASAVRILEVVKDKAGPHKEIYPYVIQELRPTLNELGISTPEELGLDKV